MVVSSLVLVNLIEEACRSTRAFEPVPVFLDLEVNSFLGDGLVLCFQRAPEESQYLTVLVRDAYAYKP